MMRSPGNKVKFCISFLALIICIMDTKTMIFGVSEGVMLCLYTVIPALFPFLVLTNLILPTVLGKGLPLFRQIGLLLGMPDGAESILLVGLLGGYPSGAKCIYDAWKNGQLSKYDAHRLLGFCNNAGPAFLFGMSSVLFDNAIVPWIIWGVHILSALFVGIILPGKAQSRCTIRSGTRVSVPDGLYSALKTMCIICGWVVLFKTIITFLQRWFLWYLPETVQVCIIGILELSNGCISLSAIHQDGVRFILCAAFLALGGLCVAMQTQSIVKELGSGYYFLGKALQCAFSVILSAAILPLLFSSNGITVTHFLPCFLLGMIIMIVYGIKRKKVVEIRI